jgi:uncharacterized membrane protein YfcA
MIFVSAMEHGTIYAMTGAFAGLLAGALGIGGGMIVVPALLYIFHNTQIIPAEIEMHVAAGSSLAIMIFTSQASVRAHYQQGEILWPLYHRLWPGIIIGVIAGAIIADVLSTQWLKIIFGIFLLIVGLYMLLNFQITKAQRTPKSWVNAIVSCLIGFKSGLLGIGGGALIIPYLTYCGVEVRKIPSLSSLCTLTVAIVGTIACSITGSNEPGLPQFCTGYVYWPAVIWVAIPSVLFAPVGAHITYALPVQQLKYGFTVILLMTGVDLLI